MPELTWIGKDKVVTHHNDVPFRMLERTYSFDAKNGVQKEDNGSENMIIHGDNLEALKALLPMYENRIKCAAVDVLYNTGNESWCYNDNVNDPRIRAWLGNVVGSAEDLSRHDKWLCMMYPRLVLIRKLLSDDGVIFINIDDHEQMHLRNLCDEIFGERNFLAQFVWQKRTSPDMRKLVSTAHEYIVSYCKDIERLPEAINKLALTEEDEANYKNPDNDPRGPWASSDFTAQGYRPNQMYEIVTPGGARYTPPEGRCWKNIESEYLKQKEEGRMWFGADGKGIPRRKTYLSERDGKNTWTWWDNKSVGHSQEATKEIARILDSPTAFDYPKPTRLMQRIIQIATKKDSIVLDSFAGSGTLAHAVLNQNKRDGGSRRFILCELGDYAETVTAERVKRVIKGYEYHDTIRLYNKEITEKNLIDGEKIYNEAVEVYKKAKEEYEKVTKPVIEDGRLVVEATDNKKMLVTGTGGSFSFYELGIRLFNEDGSVNPAAPVEEIRKYVWYSETRTPYEAPGDDAGYYLGENAGTGYYLAYEPGKETVLDYTFLAKIKIKADRYVIYADRCALSEEELNRFGITYKKTNRDIAKV